MISDSCFLKACRREPVDRTPVWMMRQAGRYLPEYRAIRAQHSFLEMCRTPELAAEVTVQPLRRFDFDAAIIFADILLPLPGMGIDLSFAKGEGPVIGNPVRTAADVDALTELTPEVDVPFLAEAIGHGHEITAGIGRSAEAAGVGAGHSDLRLDFAAPLLIKRGRAKWRVHMRLQPQRAVAPFNA